GSPPQTSSIKQFSTLARRQLRLIVSDRVYSLSLLLMPIIVGAVTLATPGKNGFQPPPLVQTPEGIGPAVSGEAQTLLSFLVIGACFMGISLSVRDLVGERTIFLRERAVGLSSTAYLLAKILVFSL
ncbi:ABC transporter permease, partial [Nocardia puris]|uniref:ABC transporter permease n=3 Tax=Nocardia TaxID=1817 RepID=UPI0018931E73